jgi:NarL family two-component system response regulator LiaR
LSEKISILIIDDHPMVREGLRAFIASRTNFEVIGEAVDGAEGVDLAMKLQPDVILMDLMMPGLSGVEAIHRIKQMTPAARILVITSFSDDDKIIAAIRAGALGYLLKDSSPQDLLKAIQDVYAGESSLHPMIARKLIKELNRPTENIHPIDILTSREIEVLGMVAQGLSNQEIAQKLNLSALTVRSHISNILSKLHLENRTQAALFAIREGLADVSDGGK